MFNFFVIKILNNLFKTFNGLGKLTVFDVAKCKIIVVLYDVKGATLGEVSLEKLRFVWFA